jgi:trk system potassium uptake protein TrkH
MLLIFFIVFMCLGTLLLKLPSASTAESLSWVDAFFTSTSAICVTGLSVVDIGTQLTMFGQFILMIFMQIGGLGYMTMASILILVFGGLNIKEKVIIQESLQNATFENTGRFTKHVVMATFIIEGIGALLLAIGFSGTYSWGKSLYLGIFHAISAFNNAGFSTFSDSMLSFVHNPLVLFTIMGLIVIGGLGFIVMRELYRYRTNKRLSLHTQLVIRITVILIIASTIILWLTEHKNTATLAMLSLPAQWMCSLFHAIVPRTAGFAIIPLNHWADLSLYVMIVLMFVGASPGGTGGGVKTTTFGALCFSIWSTIVGRKDVEAMGRRLAFEDIKKSLAIVGLSLITVILASIIILKFDGYPMIDVIFETVSAFGTVGLSTGITPHCSDASKLILCATMLIGRVGPLTVGIATLQQWQARNYRYPEERFAIG